MTKTYTFNNTNNKYNSSFANTCSIGSADYSKALDDIILAGVIKDNDYLFKYTSKPCSNANYNTCCNCPFYNALKDSDPEFTKAVKFLAHYNDSSNNIPKNFILGKMYTLADGTPIVFYDDEIQIGFDTYSYSSFNDITFLNALKPKTKKIIINIYTTGNTNINISI